MNFLVVVWMCAMSFSGSVAFPPPPADGQPIGFERKSGGSALREVEGEGAVLTVRYEGGQVREVRLEQGAPPRPPLADRRPLCQDLCYAGLGGLSCGSLCKSHMSRVFFEIYHKKKQESSQKINCNKTTTPSSNDLPENPTKGIGRPRFETCPILCENGLGQPMCGCNTTWNANVQWDSICDSFCSHGTYRLQGCPECSTAEMQSDNFRTDYGDMHEIWIEWCNYQCHKGEGGAACNCDLAPLMINPDV